MPLQLPQACPKCGASVRRITAGGVCARCLLEIGLSEQKTQSPKGAGEEEKKEAAVGLAKLGHYEVLGKIAHGGMGVVYRARDLTLNREVALKLMLAGQFAGEREVKRFRIEAEAAARLDHPNIVPIYGFGELDGRPYLSMKLVEGENLAGRLHGMPMDAIPAAQLMLTLARAIHYAHQRGVLHRDLKPANVLLDPEGQPHVTDFGLAKCLDSADGPTLSGVTLGSPNYMSPEQAAGKVERLTTSADIYSLGAIMYELLTGRPPFRADTALETMRKVMEEPPIAPRLVYKFVDSDLETICLKCMEKEPESRYGSAQALAEELERWLHHEPILARPAGGIERLGKWMRRNPKVATLALMLNLVFLIGVGGILAVSVRLASANRAKESANKQLAKNVRDFEWQKIEDLIASGKRSEALAYLAYFLRQNPSDGAAAKRLVSMLSECTFVLPAGAPLLHGSAVTCVGLSSDGRRAVTGAADGKTRIWNLSNGALEKTLDPQQDPRWSALRPHPLRVSQAWFGQDERLVFTTVGDGAFRLWDAAEGRLLFESSNILVAADSRPQGLVAVLESETSVQAWDSASGQRVGSPMRLPGMLRCNNFNPNTHEVFMGCGDGTVRISNLRHWNHEVSDFKLPRSYPWLIESSPDAGTLAITVSNVLSFWDRRSRTILRELPPQDRDIMKLKFTPDGMRLITMVYDRPLKIWEVATGRMLGQPVDAEGPFPYFEISPDGKRLVTRSQNGVLRVWDAFSGLPLTEPFEHQGPVNDLRFTPDGRFIMAASQDETAQLWDMRAGLPETLSLPTTDFEANACFSPDGRRVYYTSKFQVQVVDSQNGQCVGRPMVHGDQIYQIQISADGKKLATACFDGYARVWDVQTGQPVRAFSHGYRLYTIALSPDGRLLASGSSDGTSRIWNLETGQPVGPPLIQQMDVMHLSFRTDSSALLTASVDGTAQLWSATTGEPLWREPLRHKGSVWAAEFSPDGRAVLTASEDRSARLWDALTQRPLTRPLLHERGVLAAHFSPDGSRVLTCCEDGTARVWDAATGEPVSQTMRHKDRLNVGAFSPDGTLVLTGSRDGVVRLWDARTGYPVSEQLRHAGEIHGLQFSSDGRRFLSIARLDSLRVSAVPAAPTPVPGWMCELAEGVAGRRLNVAGEAEYAPHQPLQSFRERFRDAAENDFYSRWAHWFLLERFQDRVPAFEPEAADLKALSAAASHF